METQALAPLVVTDDSEEGMMLSVLGFLRQALLSGAPAEPSLLVRLTDGRVRVVSGVVSPNEAQRHLLRLRNEYGVLGRAFLTHIDLSADGVLLAVDSLAGGPGKRLVQRCVELGSGRFELAAPVWTEAPSAVAPQEPVGGRDQCAWLRNSAILPRSFGSSIGPLAKVDVSAAPSGADRLFVWYL